jgi:Fe-S-cluster-containing dehydrogenase component/DMSO reductase anchor subunit
VSTAIRSDLLAVVPAAGASPSRPRPTALERALLDQQTLTAVERFARVHEAEELPAQARYYRELLPASPPGPGQQYAFEVDLDRCTGCKACVTGCHNLNGLDDGEVWRTVGLLHGGTAQAPAQQTVTTACHHCVEPACLAGCPVKAYEKDPVTGIVKHLDDQCIGCQYCVFMCPYDAPKFSPSRGIVRKCDMCSDRLAHGEAPGCVQACPNEAIRISVVDRAEAVQAAEANAFLPGAPGPADTLPTTVYKTARALPRNMLPADFYSVSPEHAHPPLVAMLTLTQLSVGAFVLNLLANLLMGAAAPRALEIGNAICALAFGMVALGASTLHLGRPRYAFRAFLGLRTSWLSREIIAFSLFAGLAAAFAGSYFVPRAVSLPVPIATLRPLLGVGGAAGGALGVFCSVMVYAATKRAHWRGALTGLKFGLTAVVLGAATVLAISVLWSAALDEGGALPVFVATGAYRVLGFALIAAAALKLLAEAAVFRHLRDRHHSVGKRLALLMRGDLGRIAAARFVCGALGGLLLPALGLGLVASARAGSAAGRPFSYAPLAVVAVGGFVLALVGELCERYLFFAAAPASKMPGGIN